MSKYLIDKYRRELKAYTFSEDTYDKLINMQPKKNEVFNESFNRNIFISTPKEIYLNDNNIIYYQSLRETNDNINKWIEIFNMQTKFTDNNFDIYSYYVTALNGIKIEIRNFAKICSEKYNLKFVTDDLLSETLVKVYISILWERKLQINTKLSKILDFYCKNYTNDLLKLYNIYSTIILSEEDENIELYNEFRSKVTNAINKPKALIKEK